MTNVYLTIAALASQMVVGELEEQARELPRTQTEDLPPVKEEEWNPNFDYKRWNEDYERLKALFWAEHGNYESRDESRIKSIEPKDLETEETSREVTASGQVRVQDSSEEVPMVELFDLADEVCASKLSAKKVAKGKGKVVEEEEPKLTLREVEKAFYKDIQLA
nr:hypothetical protein Iba_chr14cCG3920 [Ipomoea batatas]